MYIERSIYGLCATLLILLVRMDTLENDGDEGKRVMYAFAVMFSLLAVFLPFVKAARHTFFGILFLIPMAFTLWYFAFIAVIVLYGIRRRAKPGCQYILVLGTSLNGTNPSRLLEGRPGRNRSLNPQPCCNGCWIGASQPGNSPSRPKAPQPTRILSFPFRFSSRLAFPGTPSLPSPQTCFISCAAHGLPKRPGTGDSPSFPPKTAACIAPDGFSGRSSSL